MKNENEYRIHHFFAQTKQTLRILFPHPLIIELKKKKKTVKIAHKNFL